MAPFPGPASSVAAVVAVTAAFSQCGFWRDFKVATLEDASDKSGVWQGSEERAISETLSSSNLPSTPPLRAEVESPYISTHDDTVFSASDWKAFFHDHRHAFAAFLFFLVDACFVFVLGAWCRARPRNRTSQRSSVTLASNSVGDPVGAQQAIDSPIDCANQSEIENCGRGPSVAGASLQVSPSGKHTSNSIAWACATEDQKDAGHESKNSDTPGAVSPDPSMLDSAMIHEENADTPEVRCESSVTDSCKSGETSAATAKRSKSRGACSSAPRGVAQWLARRRSPMANRVATNSECPEITLSSKQALGARKPPLGSPETAASVEHSPPANRPSVSGHSPSIQPRGIQEWLVRHQSPCKPSVLDDAFQACISGATVKPVQGTPTPSRSVATPVPTPREL